MSIVTRGGLTFTDGVTFLAPPILYQAVVYYNMNYSLGNLSVNSSITSLENVGIGGSAYNAIVTGSAPVVDTIPDSNQPIPYKVIKLSGGASGFNVSNIMSMSGSGSMFYIGYQSNAVRLAAFGGSGSYASCYFGTAGTNSTDFLFRDTTDGGITQSIGQFNGYRILGIVKNGTSASVYEYTPPNYTTPGTLNKISTTAGAGTFNFNTVGFRTYFTQYSTGYLGDLAYFNRALTDDEVTQVVNQLKIESHLP